jgi:hypothetical protein
VPRRSLDHLTADGEPEPALGGLNIGTTTLQNNLQPDAFAQVLGEPEQLLT